MRIERMKNGQGAAILVVVMLAIVLALIAPAVTGAVDIGGWDPGVAYADDEPTPTPTPQGPGEGHCTNSGCVGG